MFSFLHAADIHLDSPLRGLERYEGAPADELRGATRRAFENLVDLAIDEQVAFLLLAGDLYDGDWRDYNTGLFFTAQAARLADAGIRVLVVAGNHDAASKLTRRLRPPANVHVFASEAPESVALDGLDVVVHGQGFAQAAVSEDLSAGYPSAVPGRFNVGLLHTSLDGRPGHAPYAPCSLDGLRSRGYQYWALGHVHAREVVCEDPWVVFPGNLQGRHARETGPKGATLVGVEDGAVVDVVHRELDVVRWAETVVEAGAADSLEQLLEEAVQGMGRAVDEAGGRLLALRLRLVGETPLHAELHAERERLVNELRARAVELGAEALWLEKVAVDTRAPSHSPRPVADDALSGLFTGFADADDRAEFLQRLEPDLRALRAELPVALEQGDEGGPAAPEALERAMAEARALLARRLLGKSERG